MLGLVYLRCRLVSLTSIGAVLITTMATAGVLFAQKQSGASASASYTGCVSKAPDVPQTLVLATQKVCAVLKGRLSADQLVGHTVELKGILQPAASTVPATIQVDSIRSVGQACSDTCSLRPPASRGLQRPKDSVAPGSEGGTPGVVQQPH